LLCALDATVSIAAKQTEDHIAVCEDNQICGTMSKKKWRALIDEALKSGRIVVTPHDVVDIVEDREVSAHLTFDILQENGALVPYADFSPLLAELGLDERFMEEIYRIFMKKAPVDRVCSFEILPSVFHDTERYFDFIAFVQSLHDRKKACFVELIDGAVRHLPRNVLHHLGHAIGECPKVGVGINRFDMRSGKVGHLQILGARYVKMHERVFLELDEIDRNLLQKVQKEYNFQLIVESVHFEHLDLLKKSGVRYVILSE
jgi:hypothetical protein